MPIKCQSNQILTERYDYTMIVGENIFLSMKARPGEVLVVHSISVHNNTQANFTHLYKILKRRGLVCRIDYVAALATIVTHLFNHDLYLIDGDECGIALTPSAAGNTVQITFQVIRMRDDEYFKST